MVVSGHIMCGYNGNRAIEMWLFLVTFRVDTMEIEP